MKGYSFKEVLLKENNRFFIKIPFNVWEETGQKGVIPVKVKISDISFECKLIPKGNGIYYIPVLKSILDKLNDNQEMEVWFEIISGLTRINNNSPYSKEHPIRKIDSIKSIDYEKAGYCGQVVIAMLTDLSVEEIIKVMGSKRDQCSFSKVIETLDYYGFQYNKRMIYPRGKEIVMPECCIINIDNHFALYYKGNLRRFLPHGL